MSRIAIVAALEREMRPLIRDWRVNEREYEARRFRFFEKGEAVVVCGGIGAEAARRAAEAVISIFGPKVVCSAGFAGALDSSLQFAQILRPGCVVNASDGSRVRLDGGTGVLVSFSAVASPEQKSKLRESFGAQAVDMEAAAVARAAELRGTEFAVLKVISDEAGFELPPLERFVNSEGRFSEARFALFAALRPWLWLRVLTLARNSSRASRVLCSSLRDLIGVENAAAQPVRPSAAI
jgi:adenosylhomocysteine nucleosidase